MTQVEAEAERTVSSAHISSVMCFHCSMTNNDDEKKTKKTTTSKWRLLLEGQPVYLLSVIDTSIVIKKTHQIFRNDRSELNEKLQEFPSIPIKDVIKVWSFLM